MMAEAVGKEVDEGNCNPMFPHRNKNKISLSDVETSDHSYTKTENKSGCSLSS